MLAFEELLPFSVAEERSDAKYVGLKVYAMVVLRVRAGSVLW